MRSMICALFAALCIAASARAYSYDDEWMDPDTGNILYYRACGNGVEIVASETDNAYYYGESYSAMTIPSDINGKMVVNIAEWAFRGSWLTSVTIPDSVTNISWNAFEDSANLGSVVIGNGVKSIQSGAFGHCTALKSVHIGNGVKSIGHAAFGECSQLESIVIPNNVTSIGYGAFLLCSQLANVSIVNDEVVIGHNAFKGCASSLYNTTTVSGVVLVDGWAVDYTDSISANVNLEGVRGVSDSAFEGCTRIVSVSIPANIKYLGESLFCECSNLTSLTVAQGNPYFKSVSGLILTKDGKTLVYGVNGNVTIPDGVQTIGEYAFSGLSRLTSVIIPNTVSSIEDCAFSSTAITSITIPNSVTNIGDWAFWGCNGLTSIVIPSSVKSMGDRAFEWCENLKNAKVPLTLKSIIEYDDVNFAFDDTCSVEYYSGTSTPPPALVATYCVIDLSAGPSASFYPVTYLAEPPSGGFNVDTYKTTKLVLRRIEPGSFKFGGQHAVTLTKPFFIGVFEVTQKQWELVMGSNPSACNNGSPKCPVDHVSYDMIRGSSQGARWPESNSVDASSFLGKLRARSGVEFDLPTCAQWEYACLAGSSTKYSYGDSANGDYMWYGQNSSYTTHDVGTKLPNSWGLYDMHGNVWEWCLDLVVEGEADHNNYYRTHKTDPVGPESGDERPFCGGGCRNSARWATCVRSNGPSSTTYGSRGEGDELGFRLALMGDSGAAVPLVPDPDGDVMLVEGNERSFGPFIAGDKVSVNVGLFGYAAKGLPSGLKYDARNGVISGAAKKAGEYEATFTKKDEEDVKAVFVVRDEEVSVGCEELSGGTFITGVAGNADGIPLEIESETGVKSVSVTKLPTGMKYDTKTGLITGAPTKPGDYAVTVTVTTKSGAKHTETITISVAALPDNAVGTFNGFVKAEDGEENIGTFQLTATDAGKLTAKVVTATGSYSFSGTCWDSVDGDVYSAKLTTKKGERLELSLDSSAGWDANQLTGSFAAAWGHAALPDAAVVAQRNAFGKTWYFAATGDSENGWTLLYAANAKSANLTVTLNADGATKIAGKLGALSVNASGYADVTGFANGVIYADFAPIVSVKDGKATVKNVLSIRTHLWFDRSDDHPEGIGSAALIR